MPASTSTPAPSLETAVNAADPNRELAAKQAAGLRALADMIEANPELVATNTYLAALHMWHAKDADTMAKLARAALKHGANVDKEFSNSSFNLKLSWGPVRAMALGYRSSVCERVVTGTETVTRKVPDPNVDVPLVEVTETVEKVEWVCKPLLASEAVSR